MLARADSYSFLTDILGLYFYSARPPSPSAMTQLQVSEVTSQQLRLVFKNVRNHRKQKLKLKNKREKYGWGTHWQFYYLAMSQS